MPSFNVDSTGREVVAELGGTMGNKTIVITGPSQRSLGAEIALTLAEGAKPSQIILAGRNQLKISPVVALVRKANPSTEVSFVELDLADNSSVRAAAEKIKKLTSIVDILINCAGIMALREYTTSKDGVEIQMAANHLGHFLLTNLLVHELSAAEGRVVNVTSMGYTLAEVDVNDPNFEDGKSYNAWVAYARSKTANILFSRALAEKFRSKAISAVAADPGMVFDTNLQSNSGVDLPFLMEGFEIAKQRNGGVEPPHAPQVSLQQGVATLLVGALDSDSCAPTVELLHECAPISALPYATDSTIAEDLWTLSEKLVGQEFR